MGFPMSNVRVFPVCLFEPILMKCEMIANSIPIACMKFQSIYEELSKIWYFYFIFISPIIRDREFRGFGDFFFFFWGNQPFSPKKKKRITSSSSQYRLTVKNSDRYVHYFCVTLLRNKRQQKHNFFFSWIAFILFYFSFTIDVVRELIKHPDMARRP